MIKKHYEMLFTLLTVGVLVDVANKYTREALHREILKILKDYQHIPSVLILNKVC